MISSTAFSEIAVAAGSVYYGLRLGRNRAVAHLLKRAQVEITARGDKFSKDIDALFAEPVREKRFRFSIAPMNDGPVQTLLQFGRDASAQRKNAKQEALKLKQKLPRDGATVTPDDLRGILNQISVVFKTVYAETLRRKMQSSVKHAVKNALVEQARHIAEEKALEAAKGGVHHATHGMAHHLMEKGLHNLPDKWEGGAAKPLDVFEQPVADIMDQTGMTEILAGGTAIVLGAVPDVVLDAVDVFTDVLAVPGLISGVKSLWREVGMLDSGETNFGEAFVNGLLPAGLKTGAVAVGVAMDAACGFMSFGLFTAISYFGASKLKNSIHKSEIEAGLKQLEPYLNTIKSRRARAANAIGESIKANFAGFTDHVEKIPDFFARPDIKTSVDALAASFVRDNQSITAAIGQLHAQVIAVTPPNDLLDWVLRIDRRDMALQHYANIARTKISQIEAMRAPVSRLISSAETEPVFFAVLGCERQYKEGAVLQQIGQMTLTAPSIFAEYYAGLEAWKREGKILADAAAAVVSRVSSAENSAVKALEQTLFGAMEEPRARIRVNMKRLGIDPANCP